MDIVHGVIYKVASDSRIRFITPSGGVYIWAYGAWRFKYQSYESRYKLLRSIAGMAESNVFLASSSKRFIDKRVALDPDDYFAVEFMGQRFSKGRLFRKSQIAMTHKNVEEKKWKR